MPKLIDLDTFVISDTHFGHDNIIRFCNRPADHDKIMHDNWLDTIGPDDTVLHLGDVGFGKKAERWMLHQDGQLPGRKLLIKGNHDNKSDAYYEGFGFEICEPFVYVVDPKLPSEYATHVAFTHDPTELPNILFPDIIVHGHIHNNGYQPECRKDVDYRNVSVEVMNYRPYRLRDILYGGQYQSRKAAGINPYYLDKK